MCGLGHEEPPRHKSLLNLRANLKNLARTYNFTGVPDLMSRLATSFLLLPFWPDYEFFHFLLRPAGQNVSLLAPVDVAPPQRHKSNTDPVRNQALPEVMNIESNTNTNTKRSQAIAIGGKRVVASNAAAGRSAAATVAAPRVQLNCCCLSDALMMWSACGAYYVLPSMYLHG